MILRDIIDVLPFKSNIDIVVKRDIDSHYEYSIKCDLGAYNFMKNIKDAPYTCPFHKYLDREVDTLETYTVTENICENYVTKTVYKLILKEEPKKVDKDIPQVETPQIPLDLKLITTISGSSALVRTGNEIKIVKRRTANECSTYNKICIDNDTREEFFASVKQEYGLDTPNYKLVNEGEASNTFKVWDDYMTNTYLKWAKDFISKKK